MQAITIVWNLHSFRNYDRALDETKEIVDMPESPPLLCNRERPQSENL